MKRHMKMSLVLVTLLLTLAILFTGCNSEELQTQIDDNKTEATNSIKDVAADVEAAEKALADAVKELKDLIAKGDKVDADALAAAITNVNSAIDAAEKAAEDADDKLQDAIDAAIEDAEAAIESAKNAWNDATDAVVAALAEIAKIEDAFEAKKIMYSDDNAKIIANALDVAWVKAVRALDVAAADAAVAELEKTFGETLTVTGDIYDRLEKIAEGGIQCTPAEADDAAALAEVEAIIDAVKAGTIDALKTELNAYDNGAEVVDLEAMYLEYVEAYEKAVATLAGEVIKAEMDALNKDLVTLESELAATWFRYQAWEETAGNDHRTIPGFAETVDTYMDNLARFDALNAAKGEADALNTRIAAFATSVAEYASTEANYKAMLSLQKDVAGWIEVYFADPYDAEIEANTVNYQMLNVADFEAACDAFDAAVAEAKKAANDFILAVKSIEDVTLLSWDEIELAKDFYVAWTKLIPNQNTYDFLFEVYQTPADYFKTLMDYCDEFDVLQAKAYNDYVAAKAVADTVDAKTITLYSTELESLIKWYKDYTFVNGTALFENSTFANVEGFSEDALAAISDVEDGYKLSKDLVVDADDYKALTDLKAVQDKLIADKQAETEALKAQIAAIGFVFIDADAAKNTAEDAVEAARAAYTTWKNGTDADGDGFVQNAVADGCTKFVVDNYAVLTAAEAKIVALYDAAAAIKAAIAALDYTDAGMDLADLPVDFDAVAYLAEVNAAKAAYAAFIDETNGNNGNRGMITDAELAELAAAELIVSKYDALVDIYALYEQKVAEVDANAEIDATTKDDIKAQLAQSYALSKSLIEKATAVSELVDIVAKAEPQFDACIEGELIG